LLPIFEFRVSSRSKKMKVKMRRLHASFIEMMVSLLPAISVVDKQKVSDSVVNECQMCLVYTSASAKLREE
jgi:hypothetical protein